MVNGCFFVADVSDESVRNGSFHFFKNFFIKLRLPFVEIFCQTGLYRILVLRNFVI